MPLLFHRYLQPEGELGLWKIEEPESYFLDRLELLEVEKQQVDQMKGHRRLEWLAGRWLLHLMSGREQRGACLKDEYGKPYLSESLFDISLSHSRELASVMAAPRAVGVDVQRIVDKIELIAHKYMRPEEMESLEAASRLEHLHVYWGAKEALYKAYGRKKLDFKGHIFIEPFAYDVTLGQCRGYVQKEDFLQHFQLTYEQIEDYILVAGMEELGDVRWT